MNTKWVIAGLLVGAAWAVQSGAKVSKFSGRVEVLDTGGWRAVRLHEGIGQGVRVRLPAGAQLWLQYRQDGHKETAIGPCTVLIGAQQGKLLTKEGQLARSDYRNQALQLPRSGSLDAVGGQVDNTNLARSRDTRIEQEASQPKFAPAPPAVASPGALPMLVRGEPGLLVLESNEQKWSVIPPSGDLVVQDGDVELKRQPVDGGTAIALDQLPLEADHPYRVQLQREGSVVGAATFRLLEAEEEQELKQMLAAPSVTPEQRLARMDRFSQLGLHHLAAREGGRWLEESPEPNADVLQVVFDLYRSTLGDDANARHWKEWGLKRGLQVLE